MKALFVWVAAVIVVPAPAQENPSTISPRVIFERVKAATVLILAGEGAGRLYSTATGVIITKDGVILTALHAVKGAAEVQVRTADGEVFDRVELLGMDERRDIAAIKISAGALPVLQTGSAGAIAQGDPIYAVTNAGGLTWSAAEAFSPLLALRTRSLEQEPVFDYCSLLHPLLRDRVVARWSTVRER